MHRIICFGFAEWDNPYKTNQHNIMQRFAERGKRVLFIESLGLRRPTLQKKDIRRIFWRLIKWFRGVQHPHENVYVFSPLVLPFHRFAVVRWFNKRFLALQLDWVVSRYRFTTPLLWSYVPSALEYLGRWKEQLSIYHCVDELSANPLIPGEVVRKMEEEFLRKVDIVFVTAPDLYEHKRRFNENIHYLPNVADFDHFRVALLPETELPDDIASLPCPRIGFFGAVSGYKLDFDLIAALADHHPEWSFILIGATGEGEKGADLTVLNSRGNIHVLGGRPFTVLPRYLKGFDVCMLPNLINDYTRSMFPLKFFEYLSAGKPVVATDLPALREFGRFCYLSNSRDDFDANIGRALNETDQRLPAERIALASRYTWNNRIVEMSDIIEKAISERQQNG